MVKQREILRVLERAGWHIARTEDQHFLKRVDGARGVMVPLHREIKERTLLNILKQAGLTPDDYNGLRRE